MTPFRIALATTAAVLTAAAAQASTISFGATPPSLTTGPQLTDFSLPIGVPTFDTGLGTLTGVEFQFTGVVLSDVTVENLENTAASAVATTQATLTLSRPGGGSIAVAVPVATSASLALGVFDGAPDAAGSDSADALGLTSSQTTGSGLLTTAGDLALFSTVGGGTINLPVDATGTFGASGGGNLSTTGTTFATGSLVVTYTFDEVAVPEPISISLLGSLLVGFGLLRRRS